MASGGSLKDRGGKDLGGLLDGILVVFKFDITQGEVLVEVDALWVLLVGEEAEPFLVELDRLDIVLGLDPGGQYRGEGCGAVSDRKRRPTCRSALWRGRVAALSGVHADISVDMKHAGLTRQRNTHNVRQFYFS